VYLTGVPSTVFGRRCGHGGGSDRRQDLDSNGCVSDVLGGMMSASGCSALCELFRAALAMHDACAEKFLEEERADQGAWVRLLSADLLGCAWADQAIW